MKALGNFEDYHSLDILIKMNTSTNNTLSELHREAPEI
jgi:hypothetical protein